MQNMKIRYHLFLRPPFAPAVKLYKPLTNEFWVIPICLQHEVQIHVWGSRDISVTMIAMSRSSLINWCLCIWNDKWRSGQLGLTADGVKSEPAACQLSHLLVCAYVAKEFHRTQTTSVHPSHAGIQGAPDTHTSSLEDNLPICLAILEELCGLLLTS